ncbi:MAG: transposase, partial [Parasporobacterium sp.]|nr:transposase [Parasporobacterium sp.]
HNGDEYQAACFAMICHHCGMRYVEFFPNARQENLFIGMLHAFLYMGIPECILTDNMKSVVTRRDLEGNPVWHPEYESFMKTAGFRTKLCRPRHPFTKGKVERLIRFVKDNFLAGRTFWNITDLNISTLRWCNEQNNIYHKAIDAVPSFLHNSLCMEKLQVLQKSDEILNYLYPLRRISFDGFVNYEGRRFGIPYSYHKQVVRISREGYELKIFSADMRQLLVTHDVTWSRKDRYCQDQFPDGMPEEQPTAPVTVQIQSLPQSDLDDAFRKFDFDREVF